MTPDWDVPSPVRAALRRKLLRWYDRHKRDLPWRRRADDPYAQWVAEIMLQQTRVETVLAYYEPFLKEFPDPAALAVADHQDVLKRWEGLGYYRRILHLHRAARMIQDRGGTLPTSAAGFRRLPGVGDYTAAAVASIVFNERAAAVDGNVARVLARLFGVECDVLSPEGKRRIHKLAADLLPPGRPGDFNQAWMDLGSAICTPQSPHCQACPLKTECVAAQTGRADALPNRRTGRGKPRAEVTIVAGVFIHDGQMLVRRRPTGGLWSGLWEFPNAELINGAAPSRLVRRLASRQGLRIRGTLRRRAIVQHELTHRSLRFLVYRSAVEPAEIEMPELPDRGVGTAHRSVGRAHPTDDAAGAAFDSGEPTARRWVTDRGFRRLSVSTAHRKIFAAAAPSRPGG